MFVNPTLICYIYVYLLMLYLFHIFMLICLFPCFYFKVIWYFYVYLCHLYLARVAAKIIVLFVILPDLTLDYCIDLITVDF